MAPIIGILASSQTANIVTSSFESIATVNGTGTTSSISFTSIPGTYKSLQIRAITRDAVASTSLFPITARINSSATGYAFHKLYGNGSTATATGVASQTYMLELPCVSNNSTSGIVSTHIIDIHDYASTTKNKTVRVMSGTDLNGSGEIHLQSGLWANTAAMTSIIFYAPYDGFTTATTFALYGIN